MKTAMSGSGLLAILLVLAAIVPLKQTLALECFAADSPLPEGITTTTGFRSERYRAPVPDVLPGGCIVDAQEIKQAILDNAGWVLLDVYPPRGLGHDPLDGSWLNSETHDFIENSTWLPEVGQGSPTEEHLDYFKANLQRLTDNDRSRPVMFYCTSDCWQSWNAARRAMSWGYQRVLWYPEGTDGWLEAGGTLVEATPVNFFAHLDEAAESPATKENSVENTAVNDTAAKAASLFPPIADIHLIDQQGNRLLIGTVEFSTADNNAETAAIAVNLASEHFTDHFLSMRPFRCLEGSAEWFCYLNYPYDLKQVVSADDLTDLEYQLLFIKKKPSEFGIDAWNGLYYRLQLQEDGRITGTLLEGDLQVLQSPPESRYARPIVMDEFIPAETGKRLYPALEIIPR